MSTKQTNLIEAKTKQLLKQHYTASDYNRVKALTDFVLQTVVTAQHLEQINQALLYVTPTRESKEHINHLETLIRNQWTALTGTDLP